MDTVANVILMVAGTVMLIPGLLFVLEYIEQWWHNEEEEDE